MMINLLKQFRPTIFTVYYLNVVSVTSAEIFLVATQVNDDITYTAECSRQTQIQNTNKTRQLSQLVCNLQ